MAIQFSVAVRNARLDAIEAASGVSPILRIRTGAKPANCAAARSGTILATLALPVDYFAAASAGSKSKSGTWEDVVADNTGIAGHFEIMDSSGTVCHVQGNTSMAGGGGDMIINNTSFVAGQSCVVDVFTVTDGNE